MPRELEMCRSQWLHSAEPEAVLALLSYPVPVKLVAVGKHLSGTRATVLRYLPHPVSPAPSWPFDCHDCFPSSCRPLRQ
jgi:hypothetical protein